MTTLVSAKDSTTLDLDAEEEALEEDVDGPLDDEEEESDEHHDDCDCSECRMSHVGGPCGDRYTDFIEKLVKAGFQYLTSGGFRKVYKRGNVVIKVPHVNDGIVDNKVEAAAWRKYKSKPTDRGMNLAPCRVFPNGCLMMVVVNLSVWESDLPDWAHEIDSWQVGRYKDRLVAYDYALNVTERDQWEKEWGEYSVFFQNDWVYRYPHLRKSEAA